MIRAVCLIALSAMIGVGCKKNQGTSSPSEAEESAVLDERSGYALPTDADFLTEQQAKWQAVDQRPLHIYVGTPARFRTVADIQCDGASRSIKLKHGYEPGFDKPEAIYAWNMAPGSSTESPNKPLTLSNQLSNPSYVSPGAGRYWLIACTKTECILLRDIVDDGHGVREHLKCRGTDDFPGVTCKSEI